ncbi:MAG: internal scaffolding protein [Arizlama microvirus]|nr:MAG: internal scaffolding protein [Arizlama microvirus]
MIATHEERRAAARTINNEPTLTDQSGAAETDLNIILARYMQSGTLMSHNKEPMYEDWTDLPEDFRGFIETGRQIEALTLQLPDALKKYSVQQLLSMTNEQITGILKPPVTPTDEPKVEPK